MLTLRKTWLIQAVVILATILFVGIAGEFILRKEGYGTPVAYRKHPRIGYYLTPNQDVHRPGGRVHINAFGMRSRDVSPSKPARTFRILMIGDSTLYGGSYIDQEQLYASRLEKLLNRTAGKWPKTGQKVEILCLGVNGWGPQHELAFIKEFGLFQADMVQVMGPPADAFRPLYGLEALPFFEEGAQPRLAWGELLGYLFWWAHLRIQSENEGFSSEHLQREVLEDGVAAWLSMADRARLEGAIVAFEFLPSLSEATAQEESAETRAVTDRIIPELKKRNINWGFPLAFFHSYVGRPKLYHDGGHLDVFGHEVYALHLEQRVLDAAARK